MSGTSRRSPLGMLGSTPPGGMFEASQLFGEQTPAGAKRSFIPWRVGPTLPPLKSGRQSTGVVVFGHASPVLTWTATEHPLMISFLSFVAPAPGAFGSQSTAPVREPPKNFNTFVGSLMSAAFLRLPTRPTPTQIE